jgi:hypothetical protein
MSSFTAKGKPQIQIIEYREEERPIEVGITLGICGGEDRAGVVGEDRLGMVLGSPDSRWVSNGGWDRVGWAMRC